MTEGPVFYAYIHARPETRTASGVFYVGKGHDARHRKFSGRGRHHSNIIAKYGAENILVGRYECSDESTAHALEKGLIKRLRAMGVRTANFTDGGEGVTGYRHTENAKIQIGTKNLGQKRSAEVCARISASQKELWKRMTPPFLGRKHTPETLAKMSLAQTGKVRSDETKRRLSESHKGKHHAGTFKLGYKHPEETKRLMSENRKGVPKTGKGLENIRAGCAKRTGIPLSEKTRTKMSEGILAMPIVKCPHCDVHGRARGGMIRYHFSNCRHRKV